MRLSIYRARLDDEDGVAAAEATLSPDERARGAAFVFPHLRRRYRLARGFLRAALGAHLQAAPASLRFAYGPQGKPALAEPAPLCFNLSHSEDLALLAILEGEDGGDIGVDIERLRDMSDLDGVAASQYCASERAALGALPWPERRALFFRLWARKEAVLKALGTGLSLAPTEVEVSVGAPRLLRLRGDEAAARAWRLLDLDAAEGFAAALALPSAAVVTVPAVEDWPRRERQGTDLS